MDRYFRKRHIKRVFVVGCGHSGTSILIRLLGSHPDIYAIPEETSLFMHDRSKKELKRQLKSFDDEALGLGNKLWVEKTPKHVRKISTIVSVSPGAIIIGITRDPRDVACSIKARGFTFEEGVKRWINDNTCLLEAKKTYPIHVLSLEDLVRSPEHLMNELFELLIVKPLNVTNYHENAEAWYANEAVEKHPNSAEGKENHTRLRNWQINQPIFSTTRRYTKDMTRADEKIMKKYLHRIEPIASSLGYTLKH